MGADFDPYQTWLSIPPDERPANYYRLLGLPLFESNVDVISNAADRQMAFVRTFQTGQYAQQSQQLLNELAQARVTLLDKRKKAEYDAKLRAEQKSGSNGGKGIASSLGSYGEIPSAPPPSAASLTPPIRSNNPPKVKPDVQSHVTPPGGVMPVPPLSDSPNGSAAFLKKHWIALLSAFVAVQLLICGSGLLVFLHKPNKTEVAQNATEQSPKVVDGTKADSQPSEAAQLAEQYYKQSVELQEKGGYDEALNKINVAVELQPDNDLYKAQQKALILLIKTLEKPKTPPEQPPVFEPGKEAGERKTIVVNGVEFAFRWCPPGTFMMGSPESEEGHSDGEYQHQVTLTKGFWMMETEVTQKQWQAVMGNNPSYFKGDDLPVEQVSWDDCQEFCKKCTKLGLPVQLPTEAQWEYACRAGSTTAYFWGNALNGDKANCNGNYPCGTTTKGKYLKKTTPVGSYQPNDWGLYDMHGNVWERCQDWYDRDYPSGSVTDPTGPSKGYYRVFRGGCWVGDANICRSACRFYNEPYWEGILGFRCVISNDSESSKTEDVNNPDENNDEQSDDPKVQDDFIPGKKAGDRVVKVVNGVEFAFRWCPPGTFMMGSPESEEGRNDDETQHQVTLTKGFWMLETEVTSKQWNAVMGWRFEGADYPADRVNWNDCQEFCKNCTKLGLPVQLPTEAQWEYACRAGTTGTYAGNLDAMAWYGSNSDSKPHPVGTKKPNAWGLYDMYGNVWEWCADWYGDYPSGSVTDPAGPSSGSDRERVVRGGCFEDDAQYCRSVSRYGLDQLALASSLVEYSGRSRIFELGFRVVRGQ